MNKTKVMSIEKKNNGKKKKQIERQLNLERKRLVRGFSDINLKEDIEYSSKELKLGIEISIEEAVKLIREAVPNGIKSFYPSDIERLSETFPESKVCLGRNDGIVIKITGEPVIDPFIIKSWVGATNITLDGESYIYSWN